MKAKLRAILASQALVVLAFEPALAAPIPVPVPQTTLVPKALDSYPFGAADHLNVAEDLGKVGYVEEEYLVSGTANVYDWPAPGIATVRV
jgi:Alpha/beta hydrolase domain